MLAKGNSRVLFSTTPTGTVDDIKDGADGDLTPSDATPVASFYDRDANDQIAACDNSAGQTGAVNGIAPYHNSLFYAGSLCSAGQSTSIAWSSGSIPKVGRGAEVGMPGVDGTTDGLATFQGARAYSGSLGAWLSPDDLDGNAYSPMSQKSYVWNADDPLLFTDPTGNCQTVTGYYSDGTSITLVNQLDDSCIIAYTYSTPSSNFPYLPDLQRILNGPDAWTISGGFISPVAEEMIVGFGGIGHITRTRCGAVFVGAGPAVGTIGPSFSLTADFAFPSNGDRSNSNINSMENGNYAFFAVGGQGEPVLSGSYAYSENKGPIAGFGAGNRGVQAGLGRSVQLPGTDGSCN